MKILFIGDVVGKPGRKAVADVVPRMRREQGVEFVVANGENVAHGSGVNGSTLKELFASGVDIVTTGDHIWDQKDSYDVIASEARLLRPLNYPASSPGRGSTVVNVDDRFRVAVVNLVGRTFINGGDCPFRAAQNEIGKLRKQTNIILVDFHAEATSEKVALGWFLDGQVSAVIGTHTHVATADERVLPKGTAYLTDAGMTGPHDSVLGRDKEAVIRRFVTLMPQKLEVAERDIVLNGALIDVDENTGHARRIERVRVSC
jgi:metallophosphoesterase (TIGR00282 family)